MWVPVDGLRVMKDERWVLTEGLEKPSDQLQWLTPKDISRREDMTEWIVLSLWVTMKVFLANTFLANLNASLY